MYLSMLAITVATFLLTSCGEAPFSYPHDFNRRDLAKLYLIDDSREHSVTITADDVLIWKGIFEKSDKQPNIHPVGIPPTKQHKCRVRVTGGPYSADLDVDWQKGKALIVHFLDDRVVFTQHQEPVMFQ